MCGAKNNRLDVVEYLLDTLEDVRVDAVDLEGQTALFHAAMGGHYLVVKRLIEAGATPDKRSKVNNNFICYSIFIFAYKYIINVNLISKLSI